MGPILVLAAIAILLAVGWRTVRREHGRVVSALRKAEASLGKQDKRAAVTLEKDPRTGVYRPRRDT